ncbi:hypothetical protein IEO21_05227 [Rhodonia placenta]|uniref:Peptidase A1 domain-containing protein n=1 Tax=Rhodonia placenta TaxID=104341 RepID=A0A8H7U2H9_9APHY|nr:hypothetical protein IEO21_05227 [Postia placenta]
MFYLLSPTASGAISSALQEANVTFSHGSSVLENSFAQNTDVKPQFSMSMSRNDGEHTTSGGTFTLQLTSSTGNPLSEYAKITDQPILSIVNTTTGRQHWTVMIDSIILNNGTLKMNTLSPSPGSPNIMPIVPCTAMIEVAFVIGGVAYPVNPLDVVTPIGWHKDGTVVCHGAFVTLGEPDPSGPTVVLGQTFLRNAYALYNLNPTGNSNKNMTLPFVQLLSAFATAHGFKYVAQSSAQESQRAQIRGCILLVGSALPKISL